MTDQTLCQSDHDRQPMSSRSSSLGMEPAGLGKSSSVGSRNRPPAWKLRRIEPRRRQRRDAIRRVTRGRGRRVHRREWRGAGRASARTGDIEEKKIGRDSLRAACCRRPTHHSQRDRGGHYSSRSCGPRYPSDARIDCRTAAPAGDCAMAGVRARTTAHSWRTSRCARARLRMQVGLQRLPRIA